MKEIDTLEGFQADSVALMDLAAERIASTICLPAAHPRDPDDVDQATGRPAGRRALGEDRRTRARPPAPIDYSPLEGAISAAVAEHDAVTEAIVAEGVDPDEPRASFVRAVIRRMAPASDPAQLKANVIKAIEGSRVFMKTMDARAAAFEKRIGADK